jgi:hypothetical protein
LAGSAEAQEPPANSAPPASATGPIKEEAITNPAAGCLQPAPMVSWQEYDGPFNKVVGAFGRKLERKSVHPEHYKPGLLLCSLTVKDKFILWIRDTTDPITFLSAGFYAGIDQAEDNNRTWGEGAPGYGRRYGAELANAASSAFFKDFMYPSIFSEDPRYYRLAHGTFKARLGHALEHAFVAHRENGAQEFNFSEWLGTTSAVVLSNTYNPGNHRGVAPAAESVGYNVLNNEGFDILREFWPEIARKFKLPFKDEHEQLGGDAVPPVR